MLDFLKKQWNLLVGLSAWLGSTIGGFFRAPPAGSEQAGTDPTMFGQFFLTLAVGLIVIPARRYRQKTHTRWWVLTAVILLLLTPVAFFLYTHFSTAWTVPYYGSRVLIGPPDALTAHGRKYVEENQDLTPEQVVWNHTGSTAEVWTKSSLDSRGLMLAILYVAFLPLFAASMICVIQASYCGTRSR